MNFNFVFTLHLTDGSGAAIHCPDTVNDCPAGPVNIGFKLYDVAEGGTPLWTEDHPTVPVSQGIFHVVLGFYESVAVGLLDKPVIYLGLDVNNKGELTPRQRIVSAAYALRSHQAEVANAADDSAKLGGVEAAKYVTEDTIYDWCLSPTAIGEMLETGKYLNEGNAEDFLTDKGYLTVEIDPSFTSSPAAGITDDNKADWTSAYGWGDHGTEGYLKVELDPSFTASSAAGITDDNKADWTTAYGWGDHGTEGYLKVEEDPQFVSSPAAGITNDDKANWNAAYGWGDHGNGGYLTQESDPKVGSQAADKWCRSDGTKIQCDKFAPVDVEADPQFTGSPAGGITPAQMF